MFQTTTETAPFLYLRDPLFRACVVLYFVNRWVFKALWRTGFVHDHLNDLICIPIWVPIMLWGQRRLGLRTPDDPPLASEILIPLFLWSWVFEIILPASGLLGERGYSDYLDVFYYAVGASPRAPSGSGGTSRQRLVSVGLLIRKSGFSFPVYLRRLLTIGGAIAFCRDSDGFA